MDTLLIIVHVFVSLFLILIVLLQSGKGGGMGATFGGASQQIFGGRGAGSFLARLTTISAVVFFLTSLTLSMISSKDRSAMEGRLDKKDDPVAEETTEGAAGAEQGTTEGATDSAPDPEAATTEPETSEAAAEGEAAEAVPAAEEAAPAEAAAEEPAAAPAEGNE